MSVVTPAAWHMFKILELRGMMLDLVDDPRVYAWCVLACSQTMNWRLTDRTQSARDIALSLPLAANLLQRGNFSSPLV